MPAWCILGDVSRTAFAIDADPALIRRFRDGELAAFEQVYRTWSQPVYTLALRITGSPDRARDVLQDCMLKAHQNASQFKGDAPFWGWLRRIAVNEALMQVRRLRRHGDAPIEPARLQHDGAEPWRHADSRVLEQALMQLPAITRAVLWLYHVEGYTHPEIADQFGKSASFSKSQLARGTQRLRELLATSQEVASCLPRTTPA